LGKKNRIYNLYCARPRPENRRRLCPCRPTNNIIVINDNIVPIIISRARQSESAVPIQLVVRRRRSLIKLYKNIPKQKTIIVHSVVPELFDVLTKGHKRIFVFNHARSVSGAGRALGALGRRLGSSSSSTTSPYSYIRI